MITTHSIALPPLQHYINIPNVWKINFLTKIIAITDTVLYKDR